MSSDCFEMSRKATMVFRQTIGHTMGRKLLRGKRPLGRKCLRKGKGGPSQGPSLPREGLPFGGLGKDLPKVKEGPSQGPSFPLGRSLGKALPKRKEGPSQDLPKTFPRLGKGLPKDLPYPWEGPWEGPSQGQGRSLGRPFHVDQGPCLQDLPQAKEGPWEDHSFTLGSNRLYPKALLSICTTPRKSDCLIHG